MLNHDASTTECEGGSASMKLCVYGMNFLHSPDEGGPALSPAKECPQRWILLDKIAPSIAQHRSASLSNAAVVLFVHAFLNLRYNKNNGYWVEGCRKEVYFDLLFGWRPLLVKFPVKV